MKRQSLVLLFAALLAAGCLESKPLDNATGKGVIPPVDAFVSPAILGHDHKDLALHEVANAVDLVGHDYMGPNGPAGGFGEIDVQGDYAYVATFSAGFSIIDLKDPQHPKVVSTTKVDVPQTPTFGAYTADLKVDKTGNWVFLGMELSTSPGVLIYDATNKAAPKLVGFWAAPGKYLGCHMVEYAEIAGQEYVFCAPLDAAIYVGLFTPANAAGERQIVTVARWTPASQKYVADAQKDPQAQAGRTAGSGHDDMTFQLDPLTGKPTIFVSMWGLGVWFVDVSVPAAPMTLGGWMGEGSQFFRGNIHTTMAFKSGDKRIVVAIPEVAVPPAMFVIDATNFAAPKLLSEWKALPSFKNDQGTDESGTFSMHNFQIMDGKVYLEMYHGGLWIIDISTPELQKAPKPIGSYLPHMPRLDGKPYVTDQWDVVVWHGYILTGDNNAGFYVLHHTGDPAGDPKFTSFA